MSQDINRRKVLSRTATSISGLGMISVGSVAADDDTPVWAGEGDPSDYVEEEVYDSASETATTDGSRTVCDQIDVFSTVNLIEIIGEDEGETDPKIYRMGVTLYAMGPEGTQANFVRHHGASIDVLHGTLHATLDPNRMSVWPAPSGSNSEHDVATDVVWSIVKGVAELAASTATIYASPAIIAADALGSAVFNEEESNRLSNSVEYNFDHTGDSPYPGQAGHYVEFLLEPEDFSSGYPGYITEFNLEHYASTMGDWFDGDGTDECTTALVDQNYQVTRRSNSVEPFSSSSPSSKEKLSDEEIDKLGIPDHLADRELYRYSPDDMTVEKT